jgi:hypothetical protein
MYSTLLFLDRPRHLRYDIQAVVDLDQLLPEGFKTIFKMSANTDSLKIIFWAGLKHENKDLTFDEVKGYITHAIDQGTTIEKLLEMFTRTIWDQGWLSKSQEKSVNPIDIESLILQMEETNYKLLHLTPKDFYALTPQEFIKLVEFWNEQDNRNTALICATICNAMGATKTGNIQFTVEDFLPKTKSKSQTPEQMKNILMGAFG